MPFAAKTLRDPLDIVLEKETLIEPRAAAIGSGIAPAIKEIPAFAPTPAGMAPGFLGRGPMIDDEDLAEVRAAQDELVQVRIVSHGVDVHPIRINGHRLLGRRRSVLALGFGGIRFRRYRLRSGVSFARKIIHVEPFRMVRYLAEVGHGAIAVLNEVIPAPPFPNDLAGFGARGPDLDQAIRLQVRTFDALR